MSESTNHVPVVTQEIEKLHQKIKELERVDKFNALVAGAAFGLGLAANWGNRLLFRNAKVLNKATVALIIEVNKLRGN